MKEISTNENIKLINEDENEKKEILIKKENKPNSKYNYFFSKQNSNHKFVSSFKLRLLKGIDYLDEHLNFYSFIKFIFGLIFLELPLILIIFIVYSDIPEKNKYIFFPYFISVSLIIGSLLIFSMIKLANSCKMFGILACVIIFVVIALGVISYIENRHNEPEQTEEKETDKFS